MKKSDAISQHLDDLLALGKEEEAWQTIWEMTGTAEAWCEAFLKIVDKKSSLVRLQWNAAQLRLNETLTRLEEEGKPKWIIIDKSRRQGISTWAEARIFERVCRMPHKNGIVIAHKAKASMKLFRMTRRMYDQLPWKPPLVYSNRTELEIAPPHESLMEIESAEDREAGRSAEYHYAHCSEVAFWPDPETTMLGLLQTIPNEGDTMVILESTPNGAAGYFYDTWQRAMDGTNDFTPVFLAWHEDPTCRMDIDQAETERLMNDLDQEEQNGVDEFGWKPDQIKWRRFTLENRCRGDLDEFHQEYPSTPEEGFLVSGRPVFDMKSVKSLLSVLEKDAPERGMLTVVS